MLKYVNDSNFDNEVIKNPKVVLVDFYADWCGPCKMIAPVLEKLASENDNFDVIKVNVDENQMVAYQYQILSIPTLMVFKNGKVVDQIIGFTSDSNILNTINSYID